MSHTTLAHTRMQQRRGWRQTRGQTPIDRYVTGIKVGFRFRCSEAAHTHTTLPCRLVPNPSDRCHRPPSSPALLPLTQEPNRSLPYPLCPRTGAPAEVPPHPHRPPFRREQSDLTEAAGGVPRWLADPRPTTLPSFLSHATPSPSPCHGRPRYSPP